MRGRRCRVTTSLEDGDVVPTTSGGAVGQLGPRYLVDAPPVDLVPGGPGAPRRTPALGHPSRPAYDLRDAHFADPATIVRGTDVAGRLPAVGRLDLEDLLTHPVPLERIDEASATAVAKPDGLVRAVVTVTDESAPTSGAHA